MPLADFPSPPKALTEWRDQAFGMINFNLHLVLGFCRRVAEVVNADSCKERLDNNFFLCLLFSTVEIDAVGAEC